MDFFQFKKNQRAISMQELQPCFVNSVREMNRESRSVSFNGAVLFVEAALKLSSISAETKAELTDAINENKIDVLR